MRPVAAPDCAYLHPGYDCRRQDLFMHVRKLLALTALVLSSTAFAQDAAQWDLVMAAARMEGKLTYYTGLVGSPSTAAIARAFEQATGISTAFVDLRISEIRERMRAEQVAGRVIGDVLTTSYNVTTSIENNEGNIQPLRAFPDKNRVRAGSRVDNPSGTQAP